MAEATLCKYKKEARYSYNQQSRDKLTGLAKNNAKAFWNEINRARKGHDVKPTISNLEIFNYFKDTSSADDIFINVDIEMNYILRKAATHVLIV